MGNIAAKMDMTLGSSWLHGFLLIFLTTIVMAHPAENDSIVIQPNNLRIVFSDNELGPLKIALDALKKDFLNVMGTVPVVVERPDKDKGITELVVVNLASGHRKFQMIKVMNWMVSSHTESMLMQVQIGFTFLGMIFVVLFMPSTHFLKHFLACHLCTIGAHGFR